MRQTLLLAFPMALAWMPLTANISVESFGVGYVLSFAILRVLFHGAPPAYRSGQHLPDQVLAAVLYLLMLFRDIFISAVDVAKRVIDPKMPLAPGIIAVETQIDAESGETADNIAAASAHGITITPGELVVDFDGNQTIYVHCLDVGASAQVAEANQTRRLVFLRRIFK
jgi:multicomponent Na+:H+ antiporter subunit E